MSGHSKWATIKRKKAAIDQKRGKIFTRLLREIQVAAKVGGGNVAGNPRLKTAVQSAKAMSVPMDNIERAIGRGTGDAEGISYEDITYEGYGPGGVAILITSLTDNKNRTVGEVRSTLTRWNGSLGGTNSVAFLFQQKGIITIGKEAVDEDKIFSVALDAGASDIKDAGDGWEITAEVADYETVRHAVEKLGKEFQAELRQVPTTTVKVSGKDAEQLMKLLSALDDLDDVQSVTANFDIDDKELEALSS
jgi:YebC/PmpR family DNA-binding regulatory protein